MGFCDRWCGHTQSSEYGLLHWTGEGIGSVHTVYRVISPCVIFGLLHLQKGFAPTWICPDKVNVVFKEREFETLEFAQSFIVRPLTTIAKRAKIKRLQIFPCINTCLNFEFNDSTVYCSPTLFCLHEMFAKYFRFKNKKETTGWILSE